MKQHSSIGSKALVGVIILALAVLLVVLFAGTRNNLSVGASTGVHDQVVTTVTPYPDTPLPTTVVSPVGVVGTPKPFSCSDLPPEQIPLCQQHPPNPSVTGLATIQPLVETATPYPDTPLPTAVVSPVSVVGTPKPFSCSDLPPEQVPLCQQHPPNPYVTGASAIQPSMSAVNGTTAAVSETDVRHYLSVHPWLNATHTAAVITKIQLLTVKDLNAQGYSIARPENEPVFYVEFQGPFYFPSPNGIAKVSIGRFVFSAITGNLLMTGGQ